MTGGPRYRRIGGQTASDEACIMTDVGYTTELLQWVNAPNSLYRT